MFNSKESVLYNKIISFNILQYENHLWDQVNMQSQGNIIWTIDNTDREKLGIFNINDKLTQYKINWREHIEKIDDNRLLKETWREKKYRKTTNEKGRWFPGGRNRPRGLSNIVDNDDDNNRLDGE